MTRINRFHSNRGSAMITAATLAGVLTILVAGFLVSISGQYMIDTRTTQWQQALNLAEAGVEVGLNELNFHYATGSDPFGTGRGWVSAGSAYSKTVTNIADVNGKIIGDYSVTVTNITAPNAIVYATGTCYNSRGTNVARMVRIITVRKYPYGFLAKNGISFTNPSFLVDSFDSSDPTKSTGGLWDAAKMQANATVGVTAGAMQLKGAVYGKIAISGSGTVTAIQSVGNTTNAAQRATTVPTAVSLGYINTVPAPNSFAPVTVPYDTTTASSLGAITAATTINAGDYTVTSIKGSSSTHIVTINGNVRLYVSGDITYSQGGFVITAGSTLELYVLGAITLTGSSYLNNANTAASCAIYGLSPSGTTWKLTGSAGFNTVLYAPNVDVSFTGGTGISGAMVANSFSTTGAGYFHFDESLNGSGIPYSASAWKEYRNNGGTWVAN